MPLSLPGDTETLLLPGNHNLEEMSDHSFSGCSRLRRLDLSRNGLLHIGKDAFTGIDQIRILLLNDNDLNVNRLPPIVFSNLNELEELAIQDNKVSSDAVAYNDQLLSNLQNLKKLSMDRLRWAIFGRGFSYLDSLQSLHIYGKTPLPWYISNNTFQALNESDVREVVVRSSGVVDIEPLAFAHFTHLKTLDLSYTRILGFPSRCKWFHGLQYTNISTLLLKNSAYTDRQLFTLRVYFPIYLLTRLKKLVLDANNIVKIDQRVDGKFFPETLEHLSLAYNCLSDLFLRTRLLCGLPALVTLDLSFQGRSREFLRTGIKDQKPASLGRKLYWKPENRDKHMRMKRVGLQYVSPNEPVNSASLGNVAKASDIQISAHLPRSFGNTLLREYIHPKGIKEDRNVLLSQRIGQRQEKLWPQLGFDKAICCPEKLEVLNMAATLPAGYNSFSRFILFSSKSMRILNESRNYLHKIEGPLHFATTAPERLTLDFSVNSLVWLDPDFGTHAGFFIEKLFLANNNLGSQLRNKTIANPIHTLKKLTELDLSRNNIKTLQSDFFAHQLRMKRIDLSQNAMHFIGFKFTHMKNLTMLDLSGNLLDQLDRETRIAIANVSNLTVDLTDNPLLCSCLTYDFLEWLREESGRLKNWKEYDCTLGQQQVSLSNLDNLILPKLQKECHNKEWVIASSVVLFGVIVLLILSFVYHRHRFEIRYLCLRLVIKRREHQALEERDVVYDYDAFVAFDQQDKNWINEHLIPRLDSQDGEGNYRLLVHHRDFLPGTNIEENILNGIQSSRKIILILTRHFVKSNWCQFELEMSRMRCFDEGKDLIVAILLEEDIPTLQLSRTLRVLLNRNTYLLWPENPREIENFWTSLNKTLKAKPDTIIRCQCGQTMKV